MTQLFEFVPAETIDLMNPPTFGAFTAGFSGLGKVVFSVVPVNTVVGLLDNIVGSTTRRERKADKARSHSGNNLQGLDSKSVDSSLYKFISAKFPRQKCKRLARLSAQLSRTHR